MTDFFFIFLIFGACWGSFLNVVAYRLAFEKDFLRKRSHCPSCDHLIYWYDNIPLISWLLLNGKCRHCHEKISLIYPFIETITILTTAGALTLLPAPQSPIMTQSYFLSWILLSIFFSALIINMATDLHALVIAQVFSLWLIPLGVLGAFCQLIPLSWPQSILGALFGYGILWTVSIIFRYATNKEGIGVGDMELLAFIGSFLGGIGVWMTLLIASFCGVIIGGLYLRLTDQHKNTLLPFGPFIVFGALIYSFWGHQLIHILCPYLLP